MTGRQSDAAPERARRRPGQTPVRVDDPLTAGEVAAFLEQHPEFFAEHPDLLDSLSAPSPEIEGDVVNLQHFLVERLRQQLSEARHAHDSLIAIGRANLTIQARVNRAVLALLSARSFEQLIELVATDLAVILDLDAVALGVEQGVDELPPVRLDGLVRLESGTVDELIGRGRTVTLVDRTEGQTALFGAAASLISSQALIRLQVSRKTPPALLALGSRRAKQFHEGQRTELLTFLARTLERSIRAWLNLPG
jgi:uncharacterized protein YigA (DUF484 family)